MRSTVTAWFGVALLFPGISLSQRIPLSLPDALGLARERAAAVVAATGRVEEARARLLPAARRFRENPVVELTGGRRQAGETYTDLEVAVSQGFEPAARRRARAAGAGAALEVAEAELADVRRVYLGEVSAAFQRTLAAQERLRLGAQAEKLAGGLLATAERRYQMGETTALELNRVRIAAARVRAERSAAEGERLAAGGGLRALLGMGPGEALAVAGSPRELPAFQLEPLLDRIAERPDLQALAAAVRQAEAEVRMGETLARPDFGLRTGYQREEGADVVSAGVAVSLPVFQRGQEEQSAGRARAAALRGQLEAARRSAAAEVRAAFEAYQSRVQAIEELERTALPAVDDNEALAQRSFEVGEINLGELLVIRQEILETRRSHLNLLLEARLAAAELETRAGVKP
ncbi:MAG: TolC family protein [Thermoanaerobaculia bacterium]